MSIAPERETEYLSERRAATSHRENSELANSILRERIEDAETAEQLSQISAGMRSAERASVSWSQLKEELSLGLEFDPEAGKQLKPDLATSEPSQVASDEPAVDSKNPQT